MLMATAEDERREVVSGILDCFEELFRQARNNNTLC